MARKLPVPRPELALSWFSKTMAYPTADRSCTAHPPLINHHWSGVNRPVVLSKSILSGRNFFLLLTWTLRGTGFWLAGLPGNTRTKHGGKRDDHSGSILRFAYASWMPDDKLFALINIYVLCI